MRNLDALFLAGFQKMFRCDLDEIENEVEAPARSEDQAGAKTRGVAIFPDAEDREKRSNIELCSWSGIFLDECRFGGLGQVLPKPLGLPFYGLRTTNQESNDS